MSSTNNAAVAITYGPFQSQAAVAAVVVSATASNPANSPSSQSVPPATPLVTFSSLAADTYSISAQAVDSANNAIGPPATTSITISVVGSTVQIPVSLVATQP